MASILFSCFRSQPEAGNEGRDHRPLGRSDTSYSIDTGSFVALPVSRSRGNSRSKQLQARDAIFPVSGESSLPCRLVSSSDLGPELLVSVRRSTAEKGFEDLSIHIETDQHSVALHVVHVTATLMRALGLQRDSSRDYLNLIAEAMAAGDDLLGVFLQRAIMGKGAASVQKYVATAPGPLQGVQLEVELCSWTGAQRGSVPALMVRHGVASAPGPEWPVPAALPASRGGALSRDLLLEEVPALLTLCDFDVSVLFQVKTSYVFTGLGLRVTDLMFWVKAFSLSIVTVFNERT